MTNPAVTLAQPTSYAQMLNYLLPTKQVGSATYVPRFTQNVSGAVTDQNSATAVNDFDHWHSGSHTHVGLDLTYGQLNTTTGQVDYRATTDSVNSLVSVGAPVGGTVVVLNDAYHTVQIISPSGMVFEVLHMDNVDTSLNGQTVQPGAHLGTMGGFGANGVRHVHMNVYQNEKVDVGDGVLKSTRVYYDPKEVMTLGDQGRYVIATDKGLTPQESIQTTAASQSFQASDNNALGVGQTQVTLTRTLALTPTGESVTMSVAGQNATASYNAVGKRIGGDQLIQSNSTSPAAPTGHWLADAQSRQDQIVQSALTIVLPNESFRAAIYDDGGGIPTVGYGYALIDKKTDGTYKVKSELEVRASLRSAGVSEENIAKIPFVKLDAIARDLSSKDVASAKQGIADLNSGNIFADESQARRQVTNRLASKVPGLTNVLGGEEVTNTQNANQMGTLLSLYDNSPALIGSTIRAAVQRGDVDAVVYEIEVKSNKAGLPGIDIRRIDEAALYTTEANVIRVPAGTVLAGNYTSVPIPPAHSVKLEANGDKVISWTQKADAAAGYVKTGDEITMTFLGGDTTKPISQTITRRSGQVTEVRSWVEDPVTKVATLSYSFSNELGLRFQGQWQDGLRVGDSYVTDGVHFNKLQIDDQTLWIDPNGLTATERDQQSFDQEVQRMLGRGVASDNPIQASGDLGAIFAVYSNVFQNPMKDSPYAVQLAANEDGYWTDGGFIRTGVSFTIGDEYMAFEGETADSLLEGMSQDLIAANGWSAPQVSSSVLDNGLTQRSIALGNGFTLSSTYNDDRRLISVSETTAHNASESSTHTYAINADSSRLLTSTLSQTITTLPNGQDIISSETIYHQASGSAVANVKEVLFEGGAKLVNITRADGHLEELSYKLEAGQQVQQSAKVLSYSQAERDSASTDVALAGLEFMQALRHGNQVLAASSLVRLVNQAQIASNTQPVLGAVGTGLSGAISLLSAMDSWGSASDAERIAVSARAVLGANEVARAFSVDGKTGFLDDKTGFLDSSRTLGALQGVVALATLEDTIHSGNPFAIASSAMALTNAAVSMDLIAASAQFGPQAMIAVAIASIIFGGLFGESVRYPSPPPAGQAEIGQLNDGSLGILIKDEHGAVYQQRSLSGTLLLDNTRATDASNWGLGADVLSGRMVSLITELQTQASQAGLGLVLERLPTLTVHAFPSFDRNGVDNFFFAVRFNDPVSGAEQLLASAQQDLAQQFKDVAQYAGALVDATELAQIGRKQTAGVAFASETEGQYLDRLSGPQEADSLLSQAQLAAQQSSNQQSWRLLTLDLGSDGISRKAQRSAGMTLDDVAADTTAGVARFDADNDGFMELTQWVGAKEAILGIDRDGDGALSNAQELFGGAGLSVAAQGLGLKRLAYFDANQDGKLDALDPYFSSFKLWMDLNGDARSGVGELYGLPQAGVRDIQLSTGAVTFTDNQSLTLQSTQLSADALGVSVHQAQDDLGAVLSGQYVVQVEGQQAELNLTADASQDLSDILNLVRPNTQVSAADKARLTALAAKYGVDLSNPVALLGLGGGGNQAGTATGTTAQAGDVFTIGQGPDAAEVKKALEAFFTHINHDPDAGPTLVNHVLMGSEDTQFKIKAADLLAGLNGVTLLSVQDARRGSVSRTASGDVVFDPSANQHGTGYFSYTARDAAGKQSTGMVWLNIASVNDAPLTLADRFSVREDQALTLVASQLLANDSDADIATDANERLSVAAVGNAQHGSVQLVNGSVVFRADANYQGLASFDYTAIDSDGASGSAVATVTVVGDNDAPVLTGSTVKLSARPDTLLRIEAATLLAYVNDADLVYGDALRLSKVVSVGSGSAWQQKDGSVLFKAGALGDTVLTLQVADSQGAMVLVPITITVANNGAAPAALLPGPDQASEDTAVRIASTLTIMAVVSSQNGSTSLDSNGTLVFAPTLNYNGAAQVVYTVRNADGSSVNKSLDFAVAAVNDAPTVIKPLLAQTVAEDGTLTLTAAMLLATVDDVDIRSNGQLLRVSSVGDASNGVVRLNANGDAVFTPSANFNGSASFRYWVVDDAGASVGVWASVTVTPVNDTPAPLAQRVAMLEDETRTLSSQALIANAEQVDVDTKTNGDVLKIYSVTMAADSQNKGTVSLNAAGHVTFTPTANYNGQATFTYTVADSVGAAGSNTVTLDIAAVNDAPTAKAASVSVSAGTEDTVKGIAFADLTNNFTDVDGDALSVRSVTGSYGGAATIQNGQVLFTPNKDFAGTASFSYTVADAAGATATAGASLTFANVNDAPVAGYKRIEGRALEDVPLRINFNELISGAYDADGDQLRVVSVTNMADPNGTAWIDSVNQQVVFQGRRNFSGMARFNYTLADPSGAMSTQSVDVNVAPVNDNPTVRPLTGFDVPEDGFWSRSQDSNGRYWMRISNFAATVGASDMEGDRLGVFERWSYNHVQQTFASGNDLYVALEGNYSGTAGFSYRVRDPFGGYADGQVQFNVIPQNDRPWLIGLPNWPGPASNMQGEFTARIFAEDVDKTYSRLQAGIGSNPIHGDVTMRQVQYGQDPSVAKFWSSGGIPPAWDLSYANHYGDEANGRVGFNVDVWDGQGGWARQYVETQHTGSTARSGGKPVAIDLDGNGISYTNLDDSKVLFDINGDGVRDLLAWTAADDGLIVFDKNSDGLIQDLDEVSFLSYLAGSMTDLEGLSGFDTDKDGKLTANDALWDKFGVWQDKNQDGVTDAGEFKNLAAWGISAVNLESDQRMDQVGDVYIMGKSTFERSDGSTGEIADAAFRYLDGADTSTSAKPKTFNIDIEAVIRKRLEEAHNQGVSDDELRNMLQKFIADVSNEGRTPFEAEGSDVVAWGAEAYADPSLTEQLLRQQLVS